MNIYVLNRSFERVAVIDAYSSVIWAERYYDIGDCELYMAASDELLDVLQAGFYLVREKDNTGDGEYHHVMIISGVEIKANAEEGDKLIITGEDLKSILKRRVIASQTVLSGSVANCIARLLNENIISPTSARRQITNFTLGTNALLNSYSMEMQITGDVLAKAVAEICQNYGYGFDIYIKNGNFVFYLYEGEDRSFDQSTNPHVVFSGDFDNLISSDYKQNSDTYSNAAYVAGEGEGTDRTIVSVGTATGLDRYELWVDARNASSNNGAISQADYREMLAQEGTEKLSETVVTTSFEGEIDDAVNFKFGEDYFLGDLVQVRNEYGISAKTRVIEAIENEDEGGYNLVVTFSQWVITEDDNNRYLLTEDRAILFAENEIGLTPEDNTPAEQVRSLLRSVNVWGEKISELADIGTMSGTYYVPFAKSDVATYRVALPITNDTDGYIWGGRLTSPHASGYYTDKYGNPHHKEATASDYFNLQNNANKPMLRFFWETGELQVSPNGSTYYQVNLIPSMTYSLGGYSGCGFITSAQTDIYMSIPLPVTSFSTATIKNLSLVLRHVGGGYIYARSGTNGATYTAIGASSVAMVSNGAAVRSNELTRFTLTRTPTGATLRLTFAYALCTNNSGTVVTNNVPVAVMITTLDIETA